MNAAQNADSVPLWMDYGGDSPCPRCGAPHPRAIARELDRDDLDDFIAVESCSPGFVDGYKAAHDRFHAAQDAEQNDGSIR